MKYVVNRDALREAYVKRGMTMESVRKKSGVSRGILSKCLNQREVSVRWDVAIKLRHTFGKQVIEERE